VESLKDLGITAPLVAFGLFFVQAIIPVFPYFILAAASGIVFGFWQGTLIAWSGALAGACFAFYLIRLTGWEWLHAKINQRYSVDISKIGPGLGFWTILLARIFPVIPTPLINIVSAISGISFWVFFLASALGKLPTAVIYTGLGHHMYAAQDIWGTVSLLILVFAISYAGMWLIRKKRNI
jgi:uncharacterized membrane protein YdjX (TVP38/TMEM64 family)